MEKKVNNRSVVISLLFLGAFFILLMRLVVVQLLQGDVLRGKSEYQGRLNVELLPWRGTIYDRTGKELAISVSADSVYVRPSEVDDPDKTADILAGMLVEKPENVKKKLASDKPFVWLKRKMEKGKAEITENISGVGIIEESKRFYPAGMLGSHLIGFAGMDNSGLEGIELAFDRYMKGIPGYIRSKKDAKGREVVPLRYAHKIPDEGKGLVLTVDEVIQYIVEKELDRAYSIEPTGDNSKMMVKAVTAIVMKPSTGEILALANRPSFDPATFSFSSFDERRNRAVTDIFEPGSCLKIVPAAAALEEGLFESEDEIFCENGMFRLCGHTIHDVHPYDLLTFRQVFVKSSNIGAAKIASAIGEADLYRYIKKFGFGEKTGCGLPGETAGILRHPRKWSKLSLSMLSFGQEIGVSSMQLISAFSAVANGGVLMKPMVVSSVVDNDGNVLKSFEPQARRRVISEESARILTGILVDAVEKGTGRRARTPGYKVAGKTGTAQKIDESGAYSHTKFVSSFVGYIPAHKPEITILVTVDEPLGKPGECYGGRVAGPVFRRIAGQVLRYLGIPPEGIERRIVPQAAPRLDKKNASGSVEIIVEGNAYYEIETKSETGNYLVLNKGMEIKETRVLMPDIRGKNMREVLKTLAPYRLEIKFAGSGVASKQRPQPGKEIRPGGECSVIFRD